MNAAPHPSPRDSGAIAQRLLDMGSVILAQVVLGGLAWELFELNAQHALDVNYQPGMIFAQALTRWRDLKRIERECESLGSTLAAKAAADRARNWSMVALSLALLLREDRT